MTYTEKTKEILEAGGTILNDARSASFDAAIKMFEETDPPAQWVIPKVSELNQQPYSFIPVFVMELVCNKVFSVFKTEIISQYFTQDKGKFAMTTTVIVTIGRGQLGETITIYGTATEVASNIEWLKIATPTSRTYAVGNALRSRFALFGKYLKWDSFDESAGEKPSPEQPTDNDAEFNRLVTAIKEAPTKAAAQVIIDGAGSFRNALPFNSEVRSHLSYLDSQDVTNIHTLNKKPE